MKRGDKQAALRAVREISRTLPGAEEYVMVHHPAFRVGTKPFVIVGLQREATAVSVNLGPELQAQLLADERFSKTPYIGRHGWVSADCADLPTAELTALITDSYRRVAGKRLLAAQQATSSRSAGPRKAARSARGKPGARSEAHSAARPRERGGAVVDRLDRLDRPGRAAPREPSGDAWIELGLSAPARRALMNAGLMSLRDLGRISEASLRKLHGMGPSSMQRLTAAMARARVRFAS